jgi:hypothetical protein
MRPTPLPTSETLKHGAGSNGVDNCTPMCRQRNLARGLGDLSTILLKVHVQEKAYLLQPAVVSRGTLNSQQTFTPMTSARAFRSHCLQLSLPFYLNATPQAIERRSICPLNSTHRPKHIRKAQQYLSVPCTVRNHCTTKLSVSSEFNAPSQTFAPSLSCALLHALPESIARRSSTYFLNCMHCHTW